MSGRESRHRAFGAFHYPALAENKKPRIKNKLRVVFPALLSCKDAFPRKKAVVSPWEHSNSFQPRRGSKRRFFRQIRKRKRSRWPQSDSISSTRQQECKAEAGKRAFSTFRGVNYTRHDTTIHALQALQTTHASHTHTFSPKFFTRPDRCQNKSQNKRELSRAIATSLRVFDSPAKRSGVSSCDDRAAWEYPIVSAAGRDPARNHVLCAAHVFSTQSGTAVGRKCRVFFGVKLRKRCNLGGARHTRLCDPHSGDSHDRHDAGFLSGMKNSQTETTTRKKDFQRFPCLLQFAPAERHSPPVQPCSTNAVQKYRFTPWKSAGTAKKKKTRAEKDREERKKTSWRGQFVPRHSPDLRLVYLCDLLRILQDVGSTLPHTLDLDKRSPPLTDHRSTDSARSRRDPL